MLGKLLDFALGRLEEFLNAAPKPLITYTRAAGGWYAHYRGDSAYGLTKRDAAKQVLRQCLERYGR